MENFLKGLGEFAKSLGIDGGNEVVRKTIPVKKEWKAKHDEFTAVSDECMRLFHKSKTLKSAFWAMVEIDTNDFTTNKRYNDKTNEIEILGEADDNKSKLVKSPYVKKV